MLVTALSLGLSEPAQGETISSGETVVVPSSATPTFGPFDNLSVGTGGQNAPLATLTVTSGGSVSASVVQVGSTFGVTGGGSFREGGPAKLTVENRGSVSAPQIAATIGYDGQLARDHYSSHAVTGTFSF